MSGVFRPGGARRFGVALLAAAAAVGISLLAQGPRAAMTSERGGLEWATFGLFLWGAALLAARLGAERRLGRLWPFPVILLLFALRERDFHDWFFEPGLLHLGMLSSDAPPWQRAVSAAAMAGILAVLLRAAWIGARPFLRALLAREGWAWSIALGLVLAALATTTDGADRKLAGYGIVPPDWVLVLLLGAEELGDAVFALSLLLALDLRPRAAR